MSCDHQKARIKITTDTGYEDTICPICDDVRIETLDEGDE